MEAGVQRKPFEPKGDEAVWRKLYPYFAEADVDQIFNYDDLEAIAGVDIRNYRGAIDRVCKELENHHKRTLVCERRIGYRVARQV